MMTLEEAQNKDIKKQKTNLEIKRHVLLPPYEL
jgi:hypothetical protein